MKNIKYWGNENLNKQSNKNKKMGKDYSQHGESLILSEIFKKIEPKNKYFVEFGARDGASLSNTKYFSETLGWTGLLMDIDPTNPAVFKEAVSAGNINELLKKYDCPETVDLISIDIDGNDYHVLKSLNHNCTVVIIEYNSHYSKDVETYMEENGAGHIGGETSYSASYKSMRKLAEEKGYFLYKEVALCNLIFIKNEYKNLFEEFDETKLSLPNNWGFPRNEVRKMIHIN
jgi:hypothetical protein